MLRKLDLALIPLILGLAFVVYLSGGYEEEEAQKGRWEMHIIKRIIEATFRTSAVYHTENILTNEYEEVSCRELSRRI